MPLGVSILFCLLFGLFFMGAAVFEWKFIIEDRRFKRAAEVFGYNLTRLMYFSVGVVVFLTGITGAIREVF